MLDYSDPFTVIDVDKPENEKEQHLANTIFTQFQSYCERSVSGTGFHIVITGTVPKGKRRDNVEIYSGQRFMLFTGDIINGHSRIGNHQELLTQLFDEMGGINLTGPVDLTDYTDSLLSDSELHEMAISAVNGDKYDALCRGDLTGYPSQSEADLALVSILCYYSNNNEQVRRMFRYSALGKREKAIRNDKYIDYTIARVRGNEPPRVNLAELKMPAPPPAAEPIVLEPAPKHEFIKAAHDFDYPPGLVGKIAEYIYHQSPYPSKEIATSAALAFAAGVTGRQYHIRGAGLNLYLFLLARSGFGKEAAKDGIDHLMSTVASAGVPGVMEFKGPGKYASAPALAKTLSKFPCRFSIVGEGGLYLKELSKARDDSAQSTIYRMFLDIFTKSGKGKMLDSTAYSDSAKDVSIVHAPALTMLWESSNDAFDRSINLQMFEQGLIPRFIVVDVKHELPKFNHECGSAPPEWLTNAVAQVTSQVLSYTQQNVFVEVECDTAASQYMENVRETADARRRGRVVAGWEDALLSRIGVKVQKVAGVLAVWDNPSKPVVTLEHAKWAHALVTGGIEEQSKKVVDGDFGDNEMAKALKLMKRAIGRSRIAGDAQRRSMKIPQYLDAQRNLIPVAPLKQAGQIALQNTAPHYRTRIIQDCIQTLVDEEWIAELNPHQARELGSRGTKIYAMALDIDAKLKELD